MRKHLVVSLLAAVLGITGALAQEVTFTHPWAGKRVALFGDSITDQLRRIRQGMERHPPPVACPAGRTWE